ncbi:MAG: DUF4345 domain-containing protein, partial [Cyanobacteria bacterium J06607_15]
LGLDNFACQTHSKGNNNSKTVKPIAWWAIPNIEKHTAILRIICGAIFMGGIGRLLSMVQVGAPSPLAIGFTVLELLLPLLCVWQAKLSSPKRPKGI